MRLYSRDEIHTYYQGKIDGITLYAWWKDGIQYVGTSSMTLRNARLELLHKRDKALEAFSDGSLVWSE